MDGEVIASNLVHLKAVAHKAQAVATISLPAEIFGSPGLRENRLMTVKLRHAGRIGNQERKGDSCDVQKIQ